MKIVVTGANGFVGSWLVQELCKRRIEVYAVIRDEQENIDSIRDLPGVKIVYCDLSQIASLEEKIAERIDVFYHLAWIASGGPGRADYDLQLLNVKYACDTVAVASKLGCSKILFAGTISEKIAEKILDLKSTATNNIYGICKVATHNIVDVLCRKAGMDYVWMQLANIYGPNSLNGNIVGYTITEILKGEAATFGPANQPYDLLYIEDLVNAMYLLGVNATRQNCYYLGSGDVRILSDYLAEIGEVCGHPELVQTGIRPDDGLKYEKEWFDNTPLATELGFRTKYTFAEGLKQTIAWMKSL